MLAEINERSFYFHFIRSSALTLHMFLTAVKARRPLVCLTHSFAGEPMRRREFIAALGSAAASQKPRAFIARLNGIAAWPQAAWGHHATMTKVACSAS